MTRHGAVSRLVLVFSVGADQNACHHGKRTESRAYHIAHNVAVVVFARPDVAALRPDNARHRVVDESVKILQAHFFKGFFVIGFVNLLKNLLERAVVFFAYGVLGGEPEVLLCVYRVSETAVGKGFD